MRSRVGDSSRPFDRLRRGHLPEHAKTSPRHARPGASQRRLVLAVGVAIGVVLTSLGAVSASEAPPPASHDRSNLEGVVDVAAGPAAPAMAGAVSIPTPPIPEPPPLDIVEGEIRRGESLSRSLGGQGVSPATIHEIARELRPLFDFRHAQPGHAYRLERHLDGRLVRFEYRTSRDKAYHLERVGDDYLVEQRETELVARPTMIAGLTLIALCGS